MVAYLAEGRRVESVSMFNPIGIGKRIDKVQTYKRVYDTGDPTEPLKPEWFKLKRRDERWKKDIVGRKNDRCYEVEHVLEWQLLAQFITADMDKGPDSRCAFLKKYFIEEKLEMKTYKVKVAKDNGKLGTNGHFDYEDGDYLFSKYVSKSQKEPRAIDWIRK
jgi:hypothetical protein